MAIGVWLKIGEAGVRQLAGSCMEGREKWRMFFILELGPCVEMTSEMEFLTFAHTLKSFKMKLVTKSSTELEKVAVKESVPYVLWMLSLMKDLE